VAAARVVVGAVVVLVLFALVTALLFSREGGNSAAEHYDRNLRAAGDELLASYIIPAAAANERVDPDCRGRLPSPQATSCSEFVDTLRTLNPKLVASIERLRLLVSEPPGGVPTDSVLAANGLLDSASQMQDSNRLLINGWDNRSESDWAGGWELREMAGESCSK
jgi:hypothetical protein